MEGLMVVAKATRNGAVLDNLGPAVAELLESDIAPTCPKLPAPGRDPKLRRQALR